MKRVWKVMQELEKHSHKENLRFIKIIIPCKDYFLCVKVPEQRKIGKKIAKSFKDEKELIRFLQELWEFRVHEMKGVAVFALQSSKLSEKEKWVISDAWINSLNSWDWCDGISGYILSLILVMNPERKTEVRTWANSNNLWRRRASLVSSLGLVRKKQFAFPLEMCGKLCSDKEDMVQKAIGWVLREIGKRNEEVSMKFMLAHEKELSRVAIRFGCETVSLNNKARLIASRRAG